MGLIAEIRLPSSPAISFASSAQVARSTTSGGSSRTRSTARSRRAAKRNQKSVRDQSGTNLVTNDASGFGLNRPYLPWNVYATNLETAPGAAPVTSTTSGAFVALLTCATEPQHPRIRVRIRAVTGAGTAGEVRLRDRATGQVLGAILVVGTAATVETNLDRTLVAPALTGTGAPMKVDVEARITAGANTIAVLVVYAIGIGS